MRFKMSGPIELLEAMRQASSVGSGAQVEAVPKRREGAELQLGLQDIADILTIAKDVAELAPLILAGIAWLRNSRQTAPPIVPMLEVATATGRVRFALPADITVEQLEAQLAPLGPVRKP